MKCLWPGCEKDWIKDKLVGHPIMARLSYSHRRFCREHDKQYLELEPEVRQALWELLNKRDHYESD